MNKREIRFCKHHGYCEFILQSNGKYVCSKCVVDKVSNSRKKLKEKLVEYKGGKCEICGYDKCIEALEFHHLNPEEKDFGISKQYLPFEKAKKEVDKCILVCANCHREIHHDLNVHDINNEPSKEEYNEKRTIRKNKINIDMDIVNEMKSNGKTLKEISKIINVSMSTLKRRISEYN